MHDNAPPRKTIDSREPLEQEAVSTFTWPVISTDPIEHVWVFLKNKLRKKERCQNSDHLFYTLKVMWDERTPEYILNLTNSMRQRLQAVIEANGEHVKY